MRLGVVLRNLGKESDPDLMAAAARAADTVGGIADVWVNDHLAIPPDQAEGSDGRYVEALATLAFLAGLTTRVQLGAAVLVLPYRPPLLAAKWIASVQELSAGRLLLGVGVGGLHDEFRALGVPWRRRGRLTDEALAVIDRCFRDDVVDLHGQPFYFRPRPPRPPLFVGGRPPHAFRRALAHRAGWIPVGLPPATLGPLAAELRERAAAAGLPPPEVAVLVRLPLDDPPAARDRLAEYAAAGATRVVHGERYAGAAGFRAILDRLVRASGR
jgi:probable F420-dependent oxidoreductase